MICTVIADIRNVTPECPFYKLGDEVKDHIFAAKNPNLRKERIGAYLTLYALTERIFSSSPKIIWANNGKPFYEDENIYFNISHSKDMIAVSISDTKQIGVDIEGEIDSDKAQRLEDRFFRGLTFSDAPLAADYLYARVSSCGNVEFFEIASSGGFSVENEDVIITSVQTSDSFSARWTLYEATMKSGGGGFTSLPCLDMMLLESRADIKKIKNSSGVYFITTATSK